MLHSPEGKLYVGQTRRELHVRLREHCKPSAPDTPIHRAIRRHGRWDPVTKTIRGFGVQAFECSDHRLDALEARLIRRLRTLTPRGYNSSTHFP